MANILDKAIAAISPEKGYRRAVARAALSVMNNGTGYGNYGASRISRAMRSWHVGGGSAKEDIEDTQQTMSIFRPTMTSALRRSVPSLTAVR